MTVLVTGGAGFIGSHLVRRLLSDGHRVRVVDNFYTGRCENLQEVLPDVELIRGDIRTLELTRRVSRGCEAVFHLAAVPSVPRSIADPITTHEVNATGTLNVLIAARDAGAQRVVYASSSSIYGAAEELPKRESTGPLPMSPYAVSKLAGEHYCRSFFDLFGLETVALRYFNVFGPRQDPESEYAAVVPKFIRAYVDGQSPIIHGDGEQSRDFTYVGNVVEANLAALAVPGVAGRVYNIACGHRTTLNELATILREEVGAGVAAEHGPPRAGEVRHSHADISLARRDLGYEPGISLNEGLRLTVGETVVVGSRNGHRTAGIRGLGNGTTASSVERAGVDVR